MKKLLIILCFALSFAQVGLGYTQLTHHNGLAETSDDSQSENDDGPTVFC